VPNPNLTIRNFLIAVRERGGPSGARTDMLAAPCLSVSSRALALAMASLECAAWLRCSSVSSRCRSSVPRVAMSLSCVRR
jgi:hypothetical protein